MDFDQAAKRLARDQSKYAQQQSQKRQLRSRPTGSSPNRVQQELQLQREKQEQLRQQREDRTRQRLRQEQVVHSMERQLRVQSLAHSESVDPSPAGGNKKKPKLSLETPSLQFTATSIHGDGDKIALPPSVLELLTAHPKFQNSNDGTPWMFRIGILNPQYEFPASPSLRNIAVPLEGISLDDDNGDDSGMEDDDREVLSRIYLEELEHRYLSYTHGTVVEFTQEEGHVGLPARAASALLQSRAPDVHQIAVKRTFDPASSIKDATTSDHDSSRMDEDHENTPGHVAYGAFDVPDMPIEITLLRLPKGTHCTLTPTPEAVRNGFYQLPNVKLVLEQSLSRTRATLTVGDTVSTWHRGMPYQLQVSSVKPATFDAILALNTDIEVDFAAPESDSAARADVSKPPSAEPGGGRRLGAPASVTSTSQPTPDAPGTVPALVLRPEPPEGQKENVCLIQLRFTNGEQIQQPPRRRFDVTLSTVRDLYDFVSSLLMTTDQFQLVTRFPRRVISKREDGKILVDCGIVPGQELLIVERV
jgi:Ubiquitin fusion degradation protein UFD1/UBX domain